MSYKGAADKISYLERAANHSTKPRKRGSNEHLAEIPYDVSYLCQQAQKDAVEAHKLRAHGLQIEAKLNAIQAELSPINEKLSRTLPWDEYAHLAQKRKELGAHIHALIVQKSDIKRRLKEIGRFTNTQRSEIFMDVARYVLPKSVFLDVCRTTNDILQELSK